MEHLFVYGTLRKAFENDILRPILPYIKFQGIGFLKGKLFDLGEYPAVIESSSDSEKVKGEIYEIKDPEIVFNVLDEYEGVNDVTAEYSRRKKIVSFTKGKRIKSWVYIYNQSFHSKLNQIKDGDYLAFINRKNNNGKDYH